MIIRIMGVLKLIIEEFDHTQEQREKRTRAPLLASAAVAHGQTCFDRTPPTPHGTGLFGSDFQIQRPTQNIPAGISNR